MNNFIWENRMVHHLPKEMEKEALQIYDGCFDFSSYREYDEIMAFVTKCFIERNRNLDYKRSIVQVKMKFGFLTIYYEGGSDPYLDEIINTAVKMAQQVKTKIEKQYGKGGPWNRKVLQSTKSE
tara:strand:- start:695 stop:1066 length:372 start_codon:yes stop_codon:yes gene_type:complete